MTGSNSESWRVADAVAECLNGFGLRRCYGLPGEDHMTLLDAFARAGVSYQAASNESSAVLMAGADAEHSGVPGVALLSMAPGLSNAINGILNAYLDHLPVLVLSGQHPEDNLPFVVRQGFDLQRLTEPVVKWSARLTAGMDIVSLLRRAIEEATSAPAGPVFVEIPDSVATQSASVSADPPAEIRPRPRWATPVDAVTFSTIADVLRRAHHPVLVVGGRRQRISPVTVTGFSSTLRVPVFATTHQKGVAAQPANPWHAGTFLNGTMEQGLLKQADLVLMIDPDPFDFYNRPWGFEAPAMAIVDPSFTRWLNAFVAGRHVVDAEGLIARLTAKVAPSSQWKEHDVDSYRQSVRAQLLATERFSVAHAVDAALSAWPHDGFFVADAGFSKPLVALLSEPSLPGRFFASNALSTMGYALPASTGLRRSGAGPILAFLGDGSLLMRAGDLAADTGPGSSLAWLAIMDRSLTQIQVKQERHDLQQVGVTLPDLRCATLGPAFGVRGVDAYSSAEVTAAASEAIANDRPVLIGAHVDPAPSPELFELLRG